jgi:hypothetical protein
VSDKGRCGGSGKLFERPFHPWFVEKKPCPGCPDCQPDNPQGIEEKWTIPVCSRCGGIFAAPFTPSGCSCDPTHTKIGKSIEVVPLSRLKVVRRERNMYEQRAEERRVRLEEVERERDMARAGLAKIRVRERERAEAAESQRDKLLEALEAVAEKCWQHPNDEPAPKEAVPYSSVRFVS